MLVAAFASFVVGVLPHSSALPMGSSSSSAPSSPLLGFVILVRLRSADRQAA